MPRTHGLGKGKGPRPGMKRIFEESKVDDGTAAAKLLTLYNFCKSKPRVNRNNPQEISDRFVEFCKFCSQNGIVPYWHGFCNSLGYSIWGVDKWINGEVHVCEETRQEVKRIHELIQNNILQMMVDGKIRDIAAIYLTKPMDPKFYAVEVMKNNINVTNINMGELPNSEQLAGKWLPTSGNAIEVQSYKVLDIPEEKEKQETL